MSSTTIPALGPASETFSITSNFPHWTDDIKVTRTVALNILTTQLAELQKLFSTEKQTILQGLLQRITESDFSAIDSMLDLLEQIQILSVRRYAFLPLGSLYHSLASLGNRRAMWIIAHHLRVEAKNPDLDLGQSQALIIVAQSWELLGKWTSHNDASWNDGAFETVDRWAKADKFLRSTYGKVSTNARRLLYLHSTRISEFSLLEPFDRPLSRDVS